MLSGDQQQSDSKITDIVKARIFATLSRMKRLKLIACAMLFLLMPFVTTAHAAQLAFSGVILDQGNNPVLSDFTSWLSKKADYELQPSYTENYQAISDELRKHRNNMAWTCGVPFVEDHASDGQQLVAVPLFRGQPTYYSLTITRAGSEKKGLSDFKGGVLAYSDPRSNSGFVAPAFALKQQGFDINTHFRLLLHTGLHEGSINAVLHGLADVANVDEYILVEYFESHPQDKDKLIVLERFGPFPFTPIVAGSGAPQVVVERLQQALISMHEDADGKLILDQLGLDGFVVKPVSFYQPIASMLESLK